MVVITAIGQDRPGIIAALAQALYDIGANLDDATMTRLHGAFAAMIAAQLPPATTPEQVRARLAPIAASLSLALTVQTVAPAVQTVSVTVQPEHAPDHLLTVYGADRPGIVHQVAATLAARNINITDMDTRRTGSADAPLYVMLLELAMPHGMDGAEAGGTEADGAEADLAQMVDALREQVGVDITCQSLDAEAL